ncbi:MAG: gamma-glutamyl-gamma-aminobutyrate hydrolase family protein, partial [Firmicutes bacterium]|nr:gamma-glutamyl-gamma-aminobutyrate hydrolase family protein [Bacillota bacterium]
MEKIIVLDFGGQYNQLIARRVRENNVYCEVHPYTLPVETIKEMDPKGIIFTGGPNSVYGDDSPQADPAIYKLGVPILGICYGAQLLAHQLGGVVATAPVSEYGHTDVTVDDRSGVLAGIGLGGKEVTGTELENGSVFWMSHTDYIKDIP